RNDWKRHGWAALLLLIGVSIGLIAPGLIERARQFIKPTYDAFSVVPIDQGDMPVFGISTEATNFDEYKQTQVALFTSPIVLDMALTAHKELLNYPRIRNATDPQAEIRKNLTVELVPRTNLIRIGMSSHAPEEAAAIVNAVADAYVKYALNTNNSEAERRI